MKHLSPIENTRYSLSPFANLPYTSLEAEFEKLFNSLPSLIDIGGEWLSDSGNRSLSPRWFENDDAFIARIELPGVESKDVTLEVGDNALKLSAERKSHLKGGEASEISYKQSFSIPEGIEADKVTAAYEDGMLSVTFPKTELVKPRRIAVK